MADLPEQARGRQFFQASQPGADVEGGTVSGGTSAAGGRLQGILHFTATAGRALSEEGGQEGGQALPARCSQAPGCLVLRAGDCLLPAALAEAAAAALAHVHMRRLLQPGKQRPSLAVAAVRWLLCAVLLLCGWLLFLPCLALYAR